MSAPAAGPARVELQRLPKRHLVVAAVLPLALLAVLAAVWLASRPHTPTATVGSLAPAFELADLDGNPIRLEDLRGRPVIVNFWASWCGPCVEEFPLLQDAMARHVADGLIVVGVVYEDRSEAARAFMERTGAAWPAAMDPGGQVAAAYGILGPPETFFIGRDGIIRARHIGQISAASLDEELTAIIREE